jgi:hypothetical protein
MSVYDASALEETLARLRQRYTLYFNLPEGVKPGDQRNIEVALTASAQRRYPSAEVHYRRVSMSSTGNSEAAPVRVTRASPASSAQPETQSSSTSSSSARRRPAVNQDGSPISVPAADDDNSSSGPLKPSPTAPSTSTTPSGGWRRADPQDKKQ